ncbi:MAG: hypothetical protein EOS23_11875 [Mesorhizobium sp.]|nr:MAG: hypothetical protein EOS59_12180 [Mesorhizobium sp.]RWE11176.1 MAG: hypothetical protein EOS23_11875 [Mesorhizobium sp.]RWE52821.1 MAG: hypothetical protein EOS24_28905 [Mesorhizobium sp.]RWF07499.1 MAG: hypothetical protein EOS69_28220 [Mesorhizobium sp.]RWF21499.1 MAG: hypothetical protein EOS25_04815 [Mesorhizobium sp.]
MTHCLVAMSCRTWSRKCANANMKSITQHRCSHLLAKGWKRRCRSTLSRRHPAGQLSAGTAFGLPSPSSATMTKSAWVTFSIRSER